DYYCQSHDIRLNNHVLF
nr:immunoglobulin light chain junction region [Macaca mulatta]MOX69570.1 immunoglobulin light chain junction region [Macaca mulatta]MOX69673.1 immunoglobulin light chain junction region [Macaca mulatta]MOX71563.1 immunoglobulin light chain junction region [Macaca mulatta]MOX71578.1 immunoglobulin light chain junction region [Macaca mulatta]